MANYITVDYFKLNNPTVDVSQYSDTTISGMIAVASKWVDSYLDYSLHSETVVNEKSSGYINSDVDLVIFPRKRPVISVSSIQIVKGNDIITLSLTDGSSNRYDIPSTNDRISYPDSQLSVTSVSTIGSFSNIRHVGFYSLITYRAGYDSIPLDIQDAVSLHVKDQIARGMNVTGATRIQQGGISMSFESRKGESDNIADARSNLNKYRRLTPY